MKICKKILVPILAIFISIFLVSPRVFAMENVNSEDSEYYDEKGNYFNPETGEYFIWNNNERSTAKSFSFNIKGSITSSKFRLNSSSVQIKIYSAKFEYANGNSASCCNNHYFEVNLRRSRLIGDTNNYANFYAPFNSTKTVNLGGGFYTNEDYYIEVTNHSQLSYGIYLVGNGEVYCY